MSIWERVYGSAYIILDFDAFPQNDVVCIIERTLYVDLIYRGVDLSGNLVLDFMRLG